MNNTKYIKTIGVLGGLYIIFTIFFLIVYIISPDNYDSQKFNPQKTTKQIEYYQVKIVRFKPIEEISINYWLQRHPEWEPVQYIDERIIFKKKIIEVVETEGD